MEVTAFLVMLTSLDPKSIMHFLIFSLFINLSLAQKPLEWVKTEAGCDYSTIHTDASKITWDGDCKDGKVHGEGKLVIYKEGEVFYEFNGIIENGEAVDGEMKFVNGEYRQMVWKQIEGSDKRIMLGNGISKVNKARHIGEWGLENNHRVEILPNGSYIIGILDTNSIWVELKTIIEMEKYFTSTYSKDEYKYVIPIEIPKKTIAITYFDNTSGDKSYDPLIKGLADMLISDLSNIELIKMVEREKLDALLKEIDLGESKYIDVKTAQEMGKGLGAGYILTGSFIVMGDIFRIDARLIDVGNGEIIFSSSENGTKDSFFTIETKLAKEIILKLDQDISMYDKVSSAESNFYYGNDRWRKHQDHELAILYMKKALDIDSTYTMAYDNLLEISLSLGRYEDVIYNAKKLLQLHSTDRKWTHTSVDMLLETIGQAYYFLGDPNGLVEYFEKNSVNPKYERAYITNYLIANSYLQLGMYNKAIKYYEISFSPDDEGWNFEIYLDLGLAYERIGGYEKMIEITNKIFPSAIAKNDSSLLSHLYTRFAYSYQQLGKMNIAKENYEKALEQDPNNWNVHNNLGYFHLKQGNQKTAEDIFKANIQREPNNPWVYHSMGEFYQQAGEYDKAIDYYYSSLEADSTYAISYYGLGEIYEERENDLFFEYYLKAAKLNNKDAQWWVKKNKNLIDEHNNKSKKAPAADYIEELKKLAELKSLGIITDEEFEAKKKELLGL